MVGSCLKKEPKKRATSKDLEGHKFFKGMEAEEGREKGR